jgi:molybdopterin-guanine dinucleotide biosynthesis protein A
VIERKDITGIVLAGGRGSRMGGIDKGLQSHRGVPLALHALRRLAPQVGRAMISANRNLPAYAAMGVPVWPDSGPGFTGPLAGFLAGLAHCETPYLATLPCDSPLFPADLVARLAAALEAEGAQLAVACSPAAGIPQVQPVFSLLKVTLFESLTRFTAAGGREVARWMALHACASVAFDDEQAFFNVNTLTEMRQLQGMEAHAHG